jgi:hypothetical protein
VNEDDKLRVLLPHWIEHNGDHAEEFRKWADRAGQARGELLDAARFLEEATGKLEQALDLLGGPLEHGHA